MEQKITIEMIKSHGLTNEEYDKIVSILKREPNYLELGIFAVMWSEHCSYKSSRVFLKGLPTTGEYVIQGPGENAGIIDIGDGQAAVFKIESHNHPSYIEPYNGAATGVGGILRDIFTMGARPIAILNSLRFGDTSHPRTKFLVNGVVSGISGYGNRVGIPTVGGEVSFDKCYNGNILVNAFALGIVDKDKIFKGVATGVGNPVIYAGSKTGRDGIHGATMASEEFDEDSEQKKPTVQVGDPFIEKLLIDACIELMNTDYIVGIQDMGAAGLTCSTIEMPGRSGMGIDLYLDKIPKREEGMTPYELMLSESQERMLIVAKSGYEDKVMDIFKKYDLDAAIVGKVTDTGRARIFFHDKIHADLPVKELSDEAPLYNRPYKKPDYQEKLQTFDLTKIKEPADYNETFKQLISSLALASKKWVYRQYDHMVGTNSVVIPGSDAAVVRIKGTTKGIAMSCDGNSRYCYTDPFIGGVITVCESARNVACSGAKPMAITDCLNFGSPEKEEIMWQFKEVLSGISKACETLKTPIISGNVSFYNETNNTSIYPTPVITMVGLIDDYKKVCTQWFKNEGDTIVLLGENKGELGASEYLNTVHNIVLGSPPSVNIEDEFNLHSVCIEAINKGLVKSAHDCSDGGIAVAIAKSCITGKKIFGANITFKEDLRTDALLFGEDQSRIIISLDNKNLPELISIAESKNTKIQTIGKVTLKQLNIENNGKKLMSLYTDEIHGLWNNAFSNFMNS